MTLTALDQKRGQVQQPQQINRADAFHALKHQMFKLLYSDLPSRQVIVNLQSMFLAHPTSVPPDREVPRRKPSLHRSYHYQKRVKKAVF